jgi:hypothetical protein
VVDGRLTVPVPLMWTAPSTRTPSEVSTRCLLGSPISTPWSTSLLDYLEFTDASSVADCCGGPE